MPNFVDIGNPFLGVGNSNPGGGVAVKPPSFDIWGAINKLPGIPGVGSIPGAGAVDAAVKAATGDTKGALASLFGLDLLRIVILILGLICVIGAIYLFKPTQELVAAPVRAARAAAVAAAPAA